MKPSKDYICLKLAFSFISGGIAFFGPVCASASEEINFDEQVKPLFEQYCFPCHNLDDASAGIDMQSLQSAQEYMAAEEGHLLADLEWVIEEEEMPPSKAEKQPTMEERELMLTWVHDTLVELENAVPNDPGVVVIPRLNHYEYDYVMRDLTGVELEIGQYLTADSAAGEGFLNVGAAQNMTTGQFESFLGAAKKVVNHARIIPGADIQWSDNPYPPATSLEDIATYFKDAWEAWHNQVQDSLISTHERQIRRQIGDIKIAYLEAAWQYRYRSELGLPDADYREIADNYEVPLFHSSLERVLMVLSGKLDADKNEHRQFINNPISNEMVKRWMELGPPSSPQDKNSQREAIKEIVDYVNIASEINEWGQDSKDFEIRPKDRSENQQIRGQYHESRPVLSIDLTKVDTGELYLAASDMFDGHENDYILWKNGRFVMADGSEKSWEDLLTNFTDQEGNIREFGTRGDGSAMKDKSQIGHKAPGYLKFVIPDGAEKFFVTMNYDPELGTEGFVKIAPFKQEPPDYFEAFEGRKVPGQKEPSPPGARRGHSQMLTMEVWTTTNSGHTRMRENIPFEGIPQEMAEFYGISLPNDKWARFRCLFSLSAEDVRGNADEEALEELESIKTMMAAFMKGSQMDDDQMRADAEQKLEAFASRAWRRDLTEDEMARLMKVYDYERSHERSYEDSVKTALVAVLAAPNFIYRYTQSLQAEEPHPLTGRELATRLSFAIWGSIPDEELLKLGESGKLLERDVLLAQVERMIADERSIALGTQFAGQWLSFSEFDTFSGPDAERFPEFTDELRKAMYNEAIYFVMDLIREDKSILLGINADYTFLNERLAKHYGINGVEGEEMRLVQVPTDQRGGLIGMAAFHTKFAAPLRTSPVHRGIWVYEKLLNTHAPPPPPDVPLLSDEPVNEEGMTIKEQLEMHRNKPACFSCHDRFDSLGIALENFDPIGRWRTENYAGQPVDSLGEFADGVKIEGFPGLRDYLMERSDKFVEGFCSKMLAYFLGRSLALTDRPLIAEMVDAMKENGYRPSIALSMIVTSPQFTMRRDETIELSQN